MAAPPFVGQSRAHVIGSAVIKPTSRSIYHRRSAYYYFEDPASLIPAYRTLESPTNTSTTNATLYRPLLTPKFFSITSKMGQGVHNLQAKADFDTALEEKDSLLVLDCFATWCGPCKVIAPQVVKFSDNYPDARFYKIDVDEVPDVAQELGIRAMPTFLLFKNGEKVGEVVGANPKALEAAIKANYTTAASA